MISVTVDRSFLSLADLVIDNDPSDNGLWLPEDGVREPGKVWRRQRASSTWVNRSVQTHAVLDDDDVRLIVKAKAETTAALKTLKAEVEAAFFQFAFDLTITEDGQATVYEVGCADVTWNPFDSGMTKAHIAEATITAPLDA